MTMQSEIVKQIPPSVLITNTGKGKKQKEKQVIEPTEQKVGFDAVNEGRQDARKISEADQATQSTRRQIAQERCYSIESDADFLIWANSLRDGLGVLGYTKSSCDVIRSEYVTLRAAVQNDPVSMSAAFEQKMKFGALVEIARTVNKKSKEKAEQAKQLKADLEAKLKAAAASGKPLEESEVQELTQAIAEQPAPSISQTPRTREKGAMTAKQADKYFERLEAVTDGFRGDLPSLDQVRTVCIQLLVEVEAMADMALPACFPKQSDRERASSTISDAIENVKSIIAELVKLHPGEKSKQI